MKTSKNLYWILAILSVTSYAWIGINLVFAGSHTITVCLFKSMTTLPCPSCGVTRALLHLITGNIQQAVLINPLGGAAAIALVAVPPWILFDIVTRKNTLATFFLWTEKKIKTRKAIYLPLVALVLLNWGWNILKDL